MPMRTNLVARHRLASLFFLVACGAWLGGKCVTAELGEEAALLLAKPEAGAAYDSSIIILGSVDGSIHALEAQTGEVRWTLSSGGSIVSAAKGDKPEPSEKEAEASGDATGRNGEEGEAQSQALQKREPKRSLLTGEEEGPQEMPEIIPSYERGGGLWLYHEGKLKRVEMTASQIVDASPFVGEDGFIYVGRKKTNLFAVDPSSGKASWVHLAELDNPTCSTDDAGSDTLIISRSEYTLHARDARTGLQNWNVTIAEFMAHGTVREDFAFETELPLVVVSATEDGRTVRCHEAGSGALRWTRVLPAAPVCAHVWAQQRAVEMPLYSEADFVERQQQEGGGGGEAGGEGGGGKGKGQGQTISSIFLGEHKGTLFARPSPRPLLEDRSAVARLRGGAGVLRIAEGEGGAGGAGGAQGLLEGREGEGWGGGGEGVANKALVQRGGWAGEGGRTLTEKDGALTSRLLARCGVGSPEYPRCLMGSHVMGASAGRSAEAAEACAADGGDRGGGGGRGAGERLMNDVPMVEVLGEGEGPGGKQRIPEEALAGVGGMRSSNWYWMLAGFMLWPVSFVIAYLLYVRRRAGWLGIVRALVSGRSEVVPLEGEGEGGEAALGGGSAKLIANGSGEDLERIGSGELGTGETNGVEQVQSVSSAKSAAQRQLALRGEEKEEEEEGVLRRKPSQPSNRGGEWSSADEQSQSESEQGSLGRGRGPRGRLSLDTGGSNGSPGWVGSKLLAPESEEEEEEEDREESLDTFQEVSQSESRRQIPRPRSWTAELEFDQFQGGGPNQFKRMCAEIDGRKGGRARELSRNSSGSWSSEEEEDEPRGRSISLGSHMSASVQRDLDSALSWAASSQQVSSAPNSPKQQREPRTSNDWSGVSRYAQDFIQLEKLGKGGFGSVFKARQRLDMREYAVKKVRLENDPNSPSNQRVIREVRNMATLSHHPNIVRYYGTWQESTIPEESDPHWGDASMSVDWTLDQSGTLGDETRSDHAGPREPVTLLYIQMELCTTSLREMLTKEEKLTTEQMHGYLMHVAEGLMHVHSERYIHRDIKPDNIFVVNDVAKIGDFGLSVRSGGFGGEEEALDPDESLHADSLSSLNELTRGVGTHMYASPELDTGAMYDEKVDMYALGIVIFEMLHKFGTRMERIDVLGRLRSAMARPDCQQPLRRFRSESASQPNSPMAAAAERRDSGGLGSEGGEASMGDEGGMEKTEGASGSQRGSGEASKASTLKAPQGGEGWEEQRRVQLPREMLRLQQEWPVEAELVTALMALLPQQRPSARAVRDRLKELRPFDPHEEMRRKDSQIQELKAQLLKQSSGRGAAHLQLQLDNSARRLARREDGLRGKSHSQSPKTERGHMWGSSSGVSGSGGSRQGRVPGKKAKSVATSPENHAPATNSNLSSGGVELEKRPSLHRSNTDPGAEMAW